MVGQTPVGFPMLPLPPWSVERLGTVRVGGRPRRLLLVPGNFLFFFYDGVDDSLRGTFLARRSSAAFPRAS